MNDYPEYRWIEESIINTNAMVDYIERAEIEMLTTHNRSIWNPQKYFPELSPEELPDGDITLTRVQIMAPSNDSEHVIIEDTIYDN